MVEIYGAHNAVPFGWVLMLKTWVRARSAVAPMADAMPERKPAASPRWIKPR